MLTLVPPTTVAVTAAAEAELRRSAPDAGQPQRGQLERQVRETIRTLNYSRRTEQAYWHWTKMFVLWARKRHPLEMGAAEIRDFLAWLANERDVSASTQRQALHAILFTYKKVLQVDVPWIEDIPRAKQPTRLPCVLTRNEVARLFQHIGGPTAADEKRALVLRLLYGCGLRLMEALRLRVKDIDLDSRRITVREGKGNKDRVVPLPVALVQPLASLLEERAAWHQVDLQANRADVELPHALRAKYPNAARTLAWQFAIATDTYVRCPRTNVWRRHHLHEDGVQRMMKRAVQRAGIHKPASCHTLRHSYATHLLQGGADVRKIQQLLGHAQIETTAIYLHVIGDAGSGIVSPLDQLGALA